MSLSLKKRDAIIRRSKEPGSVLAEKYSISVSRVWEIRHPAEYAARHAKKKKQKAAA